MPFLYFIDPITKNKVRVNELIKVYGANNILNVMQRKQISDARLKNDNRKYRPSKEV